ncbi:N-acetyl-gamma-glutamyl-phosphate reductase [Desulfoprunum benzoelyticum]|uniref:N-acetyl-gamma-glutamyl-phosphate reductase n=1 Tax=Desulfoprunum benzoelyticum TaxID=1506996 RepID=A0A840V3X3_9BACT|nr:N-acetyl-gamma-glutamyl-phosphate reductase [Desulfoprunum benzoelyticum]MBB5349498.1 N-acetyl-gamma-glutamyl-phosphate reductase [Desulfoprunum benzoelyticum]MBM9531561.1 N-acetyl-gamma-glutamyl-phosphate reductase [Desulfoprunum benzoelyticum]
MLNIAIIGASGYTGVELARLLSNHPEVRLTLVTSRQFEGQPLSQVFPNLRTKVDLLCENPDIDRLCDSADFYFAAVPHKTAMDLVPHLRRAGKKVVDLSADFRLRDQTVYEQWYQPHSSAQFLSEAVYGLPELYRDDIAGSSLVANPGCYPTSIILGLAPLLKAGIIDPETIIADSKSGTSGAGRSAQIGSLFCEVTDGFRAYKVGGTHRHTPEIEQELSLLGGRDIRISFTPHLLPLSRGILSTIYARLQSDQTEDAIHQLYQTMYADEPFVRVLPPGNLPATQYVRGSNFCDIGFTIDRRTGRIIVLSAIDNIVKGAAGQAVQNMNIMCGFDETKGLEVVPLFP